MKIRSNIPNFITCLNVISGSLAIIFALKGQLTIWVCLILAAAVFDFLDGMAARALKAYSAIGKDLDSLADVISFGLAPGMIMFMLLQYSFPGREAQQNLLSGFTLGESLILAVALLIPVFSALRLAKFNNDSRQTSSFIGLPTPANAIFISSLALIHDFGKYTSIDHFLLNTKILLLLTILLSWLLVSEIPMFSLKFKNLNWQDNKIRIIFLILSVIFIAAFNFYGITATIVLFILLSMLQNSSNQI
jgi:CDP-diacylglycerol--serine O-phosphatidyltransferase